MRKDFKMRVLKADDGSEDHYPDFVIISSSIVSFCERTAELNHSQNLYTLNKRGGLSPLELLSIVHGTNYWKLPKNEQPTPETVYQELVLLFGMTQ